MAALTRGERLCAIAGAALFASSFVPLWGNVSTEEASLEGVGTVPAVSSSFDAWFGYGPTVELALVLALAVTIVVVVRRLLPLRVPAAFYSLVGLLMTLLVVVGIVAGPDLDRIEGVPGLDISRGPMLFAAAGAAGVVMLGGIAHAAAAGRSRRRVRSRGDGINSR